MSADNGIYILKTKAPAGEGFEYRVEHAMAIENICYNVATGEYQKDFIPEVAFDYFGRSDVFTDEGEALKYAHEQEPMYEILEYGVSILNHAHQVFPSHLTSDDVERYEVEIDREMSRQRARRDAEQQAWLEKNRMPLHQVPQGRFISPYHEGEFVPDVAYGMWRSKDGTTKHGRLEYHENSTYTFIPDRDTRKMDQMK